MFRRVHNLKQVIALGAVLLSLSTLAQSCGLYCYLGACGPKSEASNSGCSCCHTHGDHGGVTCTTASSERHDGDAESCPCSEGCWCHQAPQPFELPKPTIDTTEFTYLCVFATYGEPVVNVIDDQIRFFAWRSPPDGAELSAVSRCARLCRFLI